jgi:hypothetical protein
VYSTVVTVVVDDEKGRNAFGLFIPGLRPLRLSREPSSTMMTDKAAFDGAAVMSEGRVNERRWWE